MTSVSTMLGVISRVAAAAVILCVQPGSGGRFFCWRRGGSEASSRNQCLSQEVCKKTVLNTGSNFQAKVSRPSLPLALLLYVAEYSHTFCGKFPLSTSILLYFSPNSFRKIQTGCSQRHLQVNSKVCIFIRH